MKEIGSEESAMERVFMYIQMVHYIILLDLLSITQNVMLFKGSKYEGSWDGDRINGEGTSWYNNGNRYHGEWLNGRINGLGTLYLASGDRYSGDWKDGRRHGQGTYFYW